MKYEVDKAIRDLKNLKDQLSSDPLQNKRLLVEFRKRYPYRSSDESLIELLTNYSIEMRLLAKMLVQECRNSSVDKNFLQEIEKIDQLNE